MRVDEKLALDAFRTCKESHIKINHEICRTRCKIKYCLFVCPGHLYTLNEENNEIVVEFAGCLECGTCKIACSEGAIEWQYPNGEYGVQYRFG
ncbi:MAG TPA: 4Fe-4S dicluster domain-containing protein [Syntrophorhabdaceae bacterium]|nr:4Fe-4S dicluster domain-containing protein [Syntrophorhabdaceae bacterium]